MNPSTLQISEQLWAVAEKILPQEIHKGKGSPGGRPNNEFRRTLTGIFYVLTTGCQWRKVPCEFGPFSTVFRYFRKWVHAGVFERIWSEALKLYDDKKGIAWSWQAIDGSIKKSYFGKEKVGFSPKDNNHGGTKIVVLSDKKGIPLSAVIYPASSHESQLLEETLGNVMVERPHPKNGIQHICGDKAYDSIWCRESAGEYGYIHHFRKRREEIPKNKRLKPKRWVVERTHAWMNRYRRILNRWDVTARSYESFIGLACAAIIISKL